ncbi:MAG: hypothetical protein HYZ89_01870 [Candidatus Omnitrophica bacterium]|nr:hypothetical protein [Candidatus Omnitrophota bacterium]
MSDEVRNRYPRLSSDARKQRSRIQALHPSSLRPAVGQRVGHLSQDVLVDRPFIEPDYANDPAHGRYAPSP